MTGHGRSPIRLSVDIGGTFTDLALDDGVRRFTCKVPTVPAAPEQGFIDGMARILREAGLTPDRIEVLVHGTTLATNAVIERCGAQTALITTAGHRDILEIATEARFDQYDLMIQKPRPLVERPRRLTVPERMDAQGKVRVPLDEAAARALIADLEDIEAVAVAFLHSYANPVHELRMADLIAEMRPALDVTLSHRVCPQIREYERISTAVTNAYVRPMMAGYLGRLDAELTAMGFSGAFYLITSGGGLATMEAARDFPVRLIESGPAGGAIFAADVARAQKLPHVFSFDMGGTTAKLCIIENAMPHMTQMFEVDRTARFKKGSGLPLRIPAVELVEIGAGGCSLAQVDMLGRVAVGPRSAAADPGPAAYGKGGTRATVTDADVTLGLIAPENFAGGSMTLDPIAASDALQRDVGDALGCDAAMAAHGVYEMVCENMASAARVHASEQGIDPRKFTMVAFGGAAPLHAARVAQKIGIDRIIIPADAGVGSAVGFLAAPISYEVVRSALIRIDDLDGGAINAVLADMESEAAGIVADAALGEPVDIQRRAHCRYVGQGHEVTIALPAGKLDAGGCAGLRARFEDAYVRMFSRNIPTGSVEIVGLSVVAIARAPILTGMASEAAAASNDPGAARCFFDGRAGIFQPGHAFRRAGLGDRIIEGPAAITEAGTTTFVPRGFNARRGEGGVLVIERRSRP